MSDPTTTNLEATIALKTVTTVFDKAIDAAEIAIIASVPLLGFPLIKPLWEAFFSWIVKNIANQIGEAGAFIVIDSQIAAQVIAVVNTTNALKDSASSGDPNVIAQASKDFDAAASNLIHYNGSVIR